VRGKSIQKVTLADRNHLFRRGLKTLLLAENDMQVVAEAATLSEALAAARGSEGVLVIDMSLLDAASESHFAEMRSLQKTVPILFLGLSAQPSCLDLLVKAGGHAYLCKTRPSAELVRAIRRLASTAEGGTARTSEDLRALAGSNPPLMAGTPLTAREQEILKILAEGRTVRQTASELALSIKTVEAHKLNLMRKLNIHKRARLIDYAVENGFVEPILATKAI
jgi:two-component system response regulator NreC